MTLAVHAILNESMVPMLQSLSAILDKAIAYAEQKKIDAAVLPNARLAPNMFPLTRQVQTACDTLKNAAACLAGREPKRFEDNEKTLEDLKARIAGCLSSCAGFRRGRLRRRGSPANHPSPDRQAGARNRWRALPHRLGDAPFLFPCGHRLRHSAPQRR